MEKDKLPVAGWAQTIEGIRRQLSKYHPRVGAVQMRERDVTVVQQAVAKGRVKPRTDVIVVSQDPPTPGLLQGWSWRIFRREKR